MSVPRSGLSMFAIITVCVRAYWSIAIASATCWVR